MADEFSGLLTRLSLLDARGNRRLRVQFGAGYPEEFERVVILLDGIGSSQDPNDRRDNVEELASALDSVPDVKLVRYSYAGLRRPNYDALDTLSDGMPPRQFFNMLDIVKAFPHATDIALVGYSLGGIVISHFLGAEDLPDEIRARVRCAVLIGSPIEAWSVVSIRELDDNPDPPDEVPDRFRRLFWLTESGSRRLYARHPATLQILGENDALATPERCGIRPGRRYLMRPIVVRSANHDDLVSNDGVIELTRRVVTTALLGTPFEEVSAGVGRPLPWEVD